MRRMSKERDKKKFNKVGIHYIPIEIFMVQSTVGLRLPNQMDYGFILFLIFFLLQKMPKKRRKQKEIKKRAPYMSLLYGTTFMHHLN